MLPLFLWKPSSLNAFRGNQSVRAFFGVCEENGIFYSPKHLKKFDTCIYDKEAMIGGGELEGLSYCSTHWLTNRQVVVGLF
jgi:hypothetical protein